MEDVDLFSAFSASSKLNANFIKIVNVLPRNLVLVNGGLNLLKVHIDIGKVETLSMLEV